ncbi:hypothetical protein ABIB80_006690 [Bradyrhizobium sp. i1.15.2]
MAEEGPTQQELDEAKSYLKGSQMLARGTASTLAQALLQDQIDKLPIDYIEKHSALVDAVTLEDAKKVAQRLWGRGLLTVIVGRSPLPQPSRPPRHGPQRRCPQPQPAAAPSPATPATPIDLCVREVTFGAR